MKKTACDKNGIATQATEYSSKSGDNFNHKAEWSKLPHCITQGKPYNYYPRGRVEIKNGKANVYMNPVLKTSWIEEIIKHDFALSDDEVEIRFISDGSEHYRFLLIWNLRLVKIF